MLSCISKTKNITVKQIQNHHLEYYVSKLNNILIYFRVNFILRNKNGYRFEISIA